MTDANDKPRVESELTGQSLLECALLDKDTAFTRAEREMLGLVGLLPVTFNDDTQGTASDACVWTPSYPAMRRSEGRTHGH